MVIVGDMQETFPITTKAGTVVSVIQIVSAGQVKAVDSPAGEVAPHQPQRAFVFVESEKLKAVMRQQAMVPKNRHVDSIGRPCLPELYRCRTKMDHVLYDGYRSSRQPCEPDEPICLPWVRPRMILNDVGRRKCIYRLETAGTSPDLKHRLPEFSRFFASTYALRMVDG
jgi:hypothetical protein